MAARISNGFQLTRLVAAAFFGSSVSALSRDGSGKRGFVADGCTGAACSDFSLLTAASWYYAYNPSDPYAPNGSPLFVPMHWCTKNLANATIPASVNSTFLLNFNEPNNAHNCNLPALAIAQAMGTVMKLWPDSLLVSPATAGNGIPFFDELFGNCTALYGPKGCRISHLAVHDYSCDAKATMAYLKSVADRYKLPVWLTEFSCGDGADAKPTSQHLAYMKEILPLLEAASFVFRYAWMSARDGKGLRGLVEVAPDGSQRLTVLGEEYNKIAVPPVGGLRH